MNRAEVKTELMNRGHGSNTADAILDTAQKMPGVWVSNAVSYHAPLNKFFMAN